MPLDICPGAQHLLDRRPPSSRLRRFSVAEHGSPLSVHMRWCAKSGPDDCDCALRVKRVYAALDLMADVEELREDRVELEKASPVTAALLMGVAQERSVARAETVRVHENVPTLEELDANYERCLADGTVTQAEVDLAFARFEARLRARAEVDDENEQRGRDCLERDDVDDTCDGCGTTLPTMPASGSRQLCETCRDSDDFEP